MSKGLIFVLTKESPQKLLKTLEAIKAGISFHESDVIVVDDSFTNESIEKNRLNCIYTSKSIFHFHKGLWNWFKNDLLRKIDKHKDMDLYNLIFNIKLGTSDWNTPNARNISQLISLFCFEKKKNYAFFDDDILINEVNIHKNNSKLSGFFLTGSPDLSRLEWIEMYLLAQTDFNKSYINTLDDNYFKKLYENYGLEGIRFLLLNYTTLPAINGTKLTLIGKSLTLPLRSSIHGGGYVCKKEVFRKAFFPNHYNEDWIWFESTGLKTEFINSSIEHVATKKEILKLDDILREEEGELIYYMIKQGKERNLMSFISNKIKIIEKLIKLCEKPSFEENGGKEEIKIILIKLLDFYKNRFLEKKITEYVNIIKLNNKLRRKLIKKIEKTNTLGKTSFLKDESVVIISPHIDDAVLSVGGIVQSHNNKISIYNIFTKTNYMSNGYGDIEKITNIRKREELDMNICFKAKSYFADFEDACVRFGQDESCFITHDYDFKNDKIYIKLKKYIINLFNKQRKNTLFLFPMGIGNHVDHVLLYNIGVELIQYKKHKIAFYFDVGYEYLLKHEIDNSHIILNKITFEDKLNQILFYTSQIDENLIDTIKNRWNLFDGELIFFKNFNMKNEIV